ncbi:MAG: hypothetical protein KKG09_08285 [Verrucomicrobia bacterium]|nr:hypothetical protein [Verrucomicrobiota bacterium]MBU4248413.1 hypothetical protein [Verrucomicrobiota bacterium]MBU4290901.1 hypothetical protein [Verrucomicrobiota bacterium]MBU4497986.1 hypothetical protein [Verrucomicrobiota bacterium]MCG2679079.1 hypothetical protein [Kiritimatiellia bacterium]
MTVIQKTLALMFLFFLPSAGILLTREPPKNVREVSIIKNGDFEQADAQDPTRPDGWNKPDGLGVQWMEAPANTNRISRGKAIRINTAISEKAMVAQWQAAGISEWNIPKPTDDPVAATYGLSFYSDALPVASGQVYRLAFDYRGGGGAKVWVRGYGIWNGEKRRRWEVIVNCPASPNRWTELSQDFNPTRRTPEVTEMKVMLYSYWPPGGYWFDNVRIIPIVNVDTNSAKTGCTP